MTRGEPFAPTTWVTRPELTEDRRPPPRAPALRRCIPPWGRHASAASIPDVQKSIVRASSCLGLERMPRELKTGRR